MTTIGFTNLSKHDLSELEIEMIKHKTLNRVLIWANSQPKSEFLPQVVVEVITQDEFTHDVIIPYKDFFLVYDTT